MWLHLKLSLAIFREPSAPTRASCQEWVGMSFWPVGILPLPCKQWISWWGTREQEKAFVMYVKCKQLFLDDSKWFEDRARNTHSSSSVISVLCFSLAIASPGTLSRAHRRGPPWNGDPADGGKLPDSGACCIDAVLRLSLNLISQFHWILKIFPGFFKKKPKYLEKFHCSILIRRCHRPRCERKLCTGEMASVDSPPQRFPHCHCAS